MSTAGRLVQWEVSMAALFARKPDLTVECPEWLCECLERGEEEDAYLMLPALPPDPKGTYLGSQGADKARLVSAIFRDLLKANGWSPDIAGRELGVSLPVVKRLLECPHTTIRLYSQVSAKITAAAGRDQRLLAEVRKMIDKGKAEDR